LNSNSIKDKWDANCQKTYSKSSYEYDVGKKKLLKNINPKKIPFHGFSLGIGLNKF
jgi:hypothetical protein